MVFKFKLARRLAVLRTVAIIGSIAVTTACDLAMEPIEQSDPVVALVSLPESVTINHSDSIRFHAYGTTALGDSIAVDVAWSADGGTMSPDGMFRPGSENGTFRIISRLVAGAVSDTSRVLVRAPEQPREDFPPPPPAVASVEVVPASAELPASGTAQLHATVRDADGNILEGRSVQWSSDKPSVATVANDGLVTGKSAGTATITAGSERKSGSATVTVTASSPPPPPPGPSGWPNAPSGWVVAADLPGDAAVPTILDGEWMDGWRVAYNVEGYTSTVPDATGPHSPGRVIQMKYPAGYIGGGGPGMAYRYLNGATGVYVGLWWKVNEGWDSHITGSNKLQYIKFPGADLFTMVMHGNGGRYEMRVYNGLLSAGSLDWFSNNVSNPAVTLGEWHQVEWLVEYTPGGTGRVRWWLDGQLVGDHGGVRFPNAGVDMYQLNSVWGGTGDVKTRTDYYWYDHIHIRKK